MTEGVMQTTIDVIELGQINHLAIPRGWEEREVEPLSTQLWTLREFHPLDKPSVKLGIYYRGAPVSERSGENFERLLAKDSHEIDGQEWWSVQEVLGTAALPARFESRIACTQDWVGKRVLTVEGHWPATQEDSFTMWINAADHGCQVQELYYIAPSSEYLNFLTVAM